jgi:alpha-galactosidase
LSDAAHQQGMKFVLWFAPFFVHHGTKWAMEYAQHIYGGGQGRGGVWKIADPEARRFLIDFLSRRIDEWNIDIYREDFGIGVPPQEGPDRVGIAEMRHVEGFYEIWSELLARHPGLLIDNCCGGGRRIDMETSKLAFTLWRSDYNDIGQGLKGPDNWPLMACADQVMVTGLSLYLPFHTGPIWDMRPYCFRSAMSSGIVLYNDLDRDEWSDELARQAIAELKELRPLFQGDIYPLLPLTTSQADLYAYQLDRPDLAEGCALFFRRADCTRSACEVRLHTIDPQATYLVSITGETYEQADVAEIRGGELLHPAVQIDTQPGSALLRYTRVSP